MMLLVSSLVVTAVLGAWVAEKDHGDIILCTGHTRMRGLCASGRLDHCDNGNAAGKVLCDTVVGTAGQSEKRWELAKDWGNTIQCNIDLGFSAVGACTSGRYRDCTCSGTDKENCMDDREPYSHLLRCAKGAKLVTYDTVEKSTYDFGTDLQCDEGYVIYKICSPGMRRDCKDESGNWKSHVIGCVKVKQLPAAGSKDTTLEHLRGYWKAIGSYNQIMTYQISESVATAHGEEMSREQSKSYGFSQSLGVDIAVDEPIPWGSVTTKVGLESNQDITNAVTTAVSDTLTTTELRQYSVPCGDAVLANFHTIYQWMVMTQLQSGENGPLVATNKFLCSKVDGDKVPKCEPGYCKIADCTECNYKSRAEFIASKTVGYVAAAGVALMVMAAALAVRVLRTKDEPYTEIQPLVVA